MGVPSFLHHMGSGGRSIVWTRGSGRDLPAPAFLMEVSGFIIVGTAVVALSR